MRSSFRSNNIISTSNISSLGNIMLSHTTSAHAKFNLAEQCGLVLQKLLSKDQRQKGQKGHQDNLFASLKYNDFIYKQYENGNYYYGQIENDKFHGEGTYVFKTEDKLYHFYFGKFVHGQFSGYGKLCKLINDKEAKYIYQGYWRNGKREGQGKENYNQENTFYYKGNFSNDQRNGQGILTMADAQYTGNWAKGRMNGQGQLKIKKGQYQRVIKGKWIDDVISYGIIDYLSKDDEYIGRYEGGIKNLLRDGQGLYKINNVIFEGVFEKDHFVGQCNLKKSENENEYVIRGDFNQTKQFSANINYSNKDRYQGKVEITPKNIIRRTKGKYYFSSDGTSVQGQFEDNERGENILKK